MKCEAQSRLSSELRSQHRDDSFCLLSALQNTGEPSVSRHPEPSMTSPTHRTSEFHGPIDGRAVIAAPHCGPGGTMHFNSGEYNAANERTKRKREPFSTVPFSRDPDFVDRPNISAWIYEKCAGPATRRCRSQLAIQYCHDVREASPQTWVFWVHASTKARFEEGYRGIADRLELPAETILQSTFSS